MKKTITARRWIALVITCLLVVLLFMVSLMYIVDPYFQFRVKDNTYLVNPQFVNGGLIKNYTYDTLIIGSSMTQNFDMEMFRQALGVSPLHVSLGGMTPIEMGELLKLANKAGKADTYYICIDPSSFMEADKVSNNAPYLVSTNSFSWIQYLVSHEAWFYSLPVSSALLACDYLNISLPNSIKKEMSIDYLGNWEDDYIFGEDIVLQNYINGVYAVSDIDITDANSIAKKNIDELFVLLESFSGSVNFFFPPYSGLYWHSQAEAIDIIEDVKRYFIEKAFQHGYCVFDFQGQDFISDLNNYKDTTHYGSHINDYMVECFARGECIVTPSTVDIFNEDIQKNVAITIEKYKALLNPG